MKRMLSILLAMAVVWMLALPCAAAGEGITITNATAKPGETVYLRVALNEDLDGDSIGISYSFDSSLLKDQYRYSTWERNGTMQDFSYKKSGVWATSAAENLQGDICTLAFKVRDNAEFLETKITCYVTIKNDAQLVGEYTAEATVSIPCEHQYGETVSDGAFGHSNTCELCGHKVTKSHQWQEGEQIKDPENERIILQISECSVCGEQKKTPVEMKQEDTIPTDPIHPTEPTYPTEENTEPSQPTEPTVTMPEPTEPNFPTKPQGNVPQPGDPDREPENGDKDDHDHDGNQNQEQNNQDNPNGQDDKENSGNSGNSNNGQGEHKGDNDETPPDSPVNPDTHEPGKEDPDGGDAHAGHDHSAEDSHAETTVPKVIFGNDKDETEEHESHQHEHTEEEPQNPNVGAIVVAVVLVALMVGLPVYIFKGRKRI